MITRLALAAAIVTATLVTVGVVSGAGVDTVSPPAQARASLGTIDLNRMTESREQRVSRTADRVRLQPRPVRHEFATEALNVWRQPREQGARVGLLKWGTKVALTGQSVGHWAEVLVDGKVRWVNADYLAKKKPQPKSGAVVTGLSSAPCADGSSIESGLSSNADRVYRAVCAAFPQPTTYGGYDGHGEHVDGRAIDIMISGSVGWQIAEWLRANASTLQIRDIIYSQKIWTPERGGEGWRYMSDRGSSTANHYDHVHVAVY